MTRSLIITLSLAALAGCSSHRPMEAIQTSGDRAFETHDYAKAEAEYTAYLERRPENVEVRLGLAKTLAAQGRLRESREEYRALVDINPLDDRFVDGYVETLYKTDDRMELLTFLHQRADGRGTVSDFIRLGKYSQALGDLDGAKSALDEAARRDGGRSPRPWLAQASMYRTAGDTAKELQALRKAAYITPGDPKIQARIKELGGIPGPATGIRPPEFVDPPKVKHSSSE